MHAHVLCFSRSSAALKASSLALLAALAGCGYKGPLYLPPPPPPPAASLTLPPTPGNAPAPAAANPSTGQAATPTPSPAAGTEIPLDEIRGK